MECFEIRSEEQVLVKRNERNICTNFKNESLEIKLWQNIDRDYLVIAGINSIICKILFSKFFFVASEQCIPLMGKNTR